MSYVPDEKQLDTLIKNLQSVPFFEWATRPLGFHFWEIDLHGYNIYYPKFIGKKFKYVFLLSKGTVEIQYRDKKQHEAFITSLQKKFNDSVFLVQHEKKLATIYKQNWKLAELLQDTDWSKQSNKELITAYKKYHNTFAELIGAVSTGILIMEAMAKEVRRKIEQVIHTQNLPDNVDLLVRTLSTPVDLSMTAQEELEFMTILKEKGDLKAHQEKWSYIPVYAQFDPWTIEDYKSRASSLNPQKIEKKYKELSSYKKTVLAQKKKILKKLNLGKDFEDSVTLLSKYLYWRINDETTIGLLTYSRDSFIREIAKRLYLSKKQVEFLIPEEIRGSLKTGSVPTQLCNERMKRFAIIINPDGVAVLSGKALDKLLKNIKLSKQEKKEKDITSWEGTPATPGIVRGRVKIVPDPNSVNKVKEGDILVAVQTIPAYVVAMKIAGAIITEEGGITSHAAIVSRELEIPCVIGIPNITQTLQDGDMVEVDADKGTVTKI